MAHNIGSDPFKIFSDWFKQAEASEPSYANAMTLSTVNAEGQPSSRTVLLKSWDENEFVFFTNMNSRKGQDIATNPHVALLFYWKSLEKQIRIEGKATPITRSETEKYFASRPEMSRIGAWASLQSQELDQRSTFEQRVEDYIQKFKGQDIPCPPHWSGYRVVPSYFEFWIEYEFRLHNRYTFTKSDDAWNTGQLYP